MHDSVEGSLKLCSYMCIDNHKMLIQLQVITIIMSSPDVLPYLQCVMLNSHKAPMACCS